MFNSIDHQDTDITFKVAIVSSRFNKPVTSKLLEGAMHELESRGFTQDQVTIVHVPGAVEIPLAAKHLASKDYAAVICLGAVIRGETTHYDYVCEQVSQGCQQVALTYDKPIVFGVLTTENGEQAFDRCGGKHGHKGVESVECACEMVATLRQILT